MSIFKDIAKKVSNDIQKVYYNSIKGEQTPNAQKAFDKLKRVLATSSLDKEWADEIFKDFDHTKVDLTREEVEFYQSSAGKPSPSGLGCRGKKSDCLIY